MYIVGSLTILFVTFFFSLFADRLEPLQAFIKAQQLVEQNGLSDAARPLLEISRRDPDLAPWADLLEGKVLAANSKSTAAIQLLSKIPDAHASSLDARLEILKIVHKVDGEKVPSKYKPGNIMEYILDLERDAQGARRKDILSNIDFFKVELGVKQHEYTLAADTLMKLREDPRDPEVSKRAKDLLFDLRKRYPKEFDLVSLADREREAKILLKEGELDDALKLIKEAEDLTTRSSPAFVDLAMLETQVLRKMDKHRDLEQILNEIVAANTPGMQKSRKDESQTPIVKLAERALLELSKHFWNKNDTQKTLTYTNQLISLANEQGSSALRAEAYYIQGRAYEEAGRLNEAIETYAKINQEQPSISIKISAQRRLAWAAIRNRNYPQALNAFESIIATLDNNLSGKGLSSPSNEGEYSLSLAQMSDELRHALYWSAKILIENAPQKTDQALAGAKKKIERIIDESPFSYYAFLGAKLLNQDYPFDYDQPHNDSDLCYQNKPSDTFQKHLKRMTEVNLSDNAEKEINWFFYRKLSPAPVNNKPSSTDSHPGIAISTALSRSKLFQELGIYRIGIGAAIEAESLTRDWPSQFPQHASDPAINDEVSKIKSSCAEELLLRLYPKAYAEEFERAADDKNQLDLPLLLAISRRESHFDPKAKSSAGAMGLMQLMPATAKMEGLGQNEDIYDPKVNITLGSKHLQRLIHDFDANKAQAIAAYNAGSNPVKTWLSQFPNLTTEEWIELIGFSETRQYVKAVLLGEHLYKRVLTD